MHVTLRALDSHPKGRTTNMVCWNLRQVYILEVGLTQILSNHGIGSTSHSFRDPCRFFIQGNLLGNFRFLSSSVK